ncbi:MAG TPA: fructose-6-phosphate aldolase [Spirochaetes bacterium]|nr:fructose-6-phosphate aldolase [Spirochaetota bacterium]
MKFFIDTADINEIRKAKEVGILDGVTTNPSLVSKVKKPHREVLEEIVREVPGPVSAEVISVECDGILKEARELAAIGDNIVIKVPLIAEGLKAVKILCGEGIKTNVTLCFSSLQALMAAKAGATYISPFIGRLDDIASEGMELVEEIVTIYENYGFETEVIVASIRNPLHIKHAAMIGAHIATIPYGVFEKILYHPLTDIGLAKFLEDHKKIPH